jgi:lipopolysaccharide/colanic/teichoic acid biosynthesis glycosyltransferase
MPELYGQITGRIPVEHIGDRWLVSLPLDRDSRGFYPLAKRAMDIAIAGIGVLVLAPVFPFLALALYLDSPGPVFYRPERLGRGGKLFRVWKFRTMVPDADRIGDPTFTKKDDDRITRVGRILRATHVDEFPQFINILKGEMSAVGPRPERHLAEFEETIPFYRARYAVKPGMAGWGLVKQGYAEGAEDTLIKLQYDLYYIKHRSLSLDILILAKTAIDMVTFGGR